ncbi:unnamed protein product [Oreochromis niloticus]|nr:unnamed protein product [Mustela putorius furo]
MPKKEKGVYRFCLFGNKKKTITINDIIETVEQLKKHGMQLEDHALHKDGPWGQVCLTLGIENNKNNRYRICDAFRQNLSIPVKGDSDNGQKPTEQEELSAAASLSPDISLQEDGQLSPEQQPEELSAAASLSPDISSQEDGQLSPEQPNSNSSDDGFIRIRVPLEQTFFFLKRKEWTNIKNKRSQRGYKGLQWTNLISDGIRTVFPYCSFAFKRHRVKALDSIMKTI